MLHDCQEGRKILEANGLCCVRGDFTVFSDLEFSLPRGKALVLRGPNGSGKSTLIKAIAGLLPLLGGSLSCDGEEFTGDGDWISDNICYLAHKNALKGELTVQENIAFWARLRGTGDRVVEAMIALGIDRLADQPARYLSSGQGRRTALARILCHDASVWLLDEPTVGLDQDGVQKLSRVMTSHLDSGGLIVTATHIDLALPPERVVFLDMGAFSGGAASAGEDWFLSEVWS
ncbi:heme ABC exporter ATP-binding protein CcmA [Emcibacter sp.]|uniref:heme ABC exporter ATP-binding protein CcmA n=1 Tax=Emcibacter sp. TaxID=1979954 RepID=UPI003A8DDD8A